MKTTWKILFTLCFSILISCDQNAKSIDVGWEYDMPNGLTDCSVFLLKHKGMGNYLYVVRCPHSNVSTNWISRKSNQSASVVEVDSAQFVD